MQAKDSEYCPNCHTLGAACHLITMSVQEIFCYTALSVSSLQKYGDW